GSLAATLFDGGRIRSRIVAQDAVQEQALVAYEKTVLGALEDVENALVAYATGRERVTARRDAAEAARNAALLARNLYQAGLADFQKVLDTERTRLSAEDSLATAQADLLTAVVQLYKALGGGWDAAPAAANPEYTPS
ncbi:MAG: TolC family protein, partial [Zoogloea sp.]|nr:TolC family protein [Zoogloea sp.]